MSNFETLHTFPMSVTYIYVFNLPPAMSVDMTILHVLYQ